MSTLTTTPDAVERVAWAHGVPVEAGTEGGRTYIYATYAGVTYRARMADEERAS